MAFVVAVAALAPLVHFCTCLPLTPTHPQPCPVDDAVLEVVVLIEVDAPCRGGLSQPVLLQVLRHGAPLPRTVMLHVAELGARCLGAPLLARLSAEAVMLRGAAPPPPPPPDLNAPWCRLGPRPALDVVLLSGTLQDIEVLADGYRKDRASALCSLWTPAATGVVVVLWPESETSARSESLAALTLLWERGMTRTLVLLERPGTAEAAAVDMLAVYPFRRTRPGAEAGAGLCGRGLTMSALEKIASWSAARGLVVDSGRHLFDGRVPRDLGGCRVPVIARWMPTSFLKTPRAPRGMLLEMWAAVAAQLNVQAVDPVPLSLEHIIQEDNGSWSGVLGAVQRGEADVAIGELHDRDDRLRQFDCTSPTAWQGLRVWLRRPRHAKAISIPYFNLDREGQVVAALSRPPRLHQVASLEELSLSPDYRLGVMYNFSMQVILDADDDAVLVRLKRRLVAECTRDFAACLARVHRGQPGWTVVATEESMAVATLDSGGTGHYYAVPGVLVEQLMSWYTRPGFLLGERLTLAVSRLWAAGLVDLWRDEVLGQRERARRRHYHGHVHATHWGPEAGGPGPGHGPHAAAAPGDTLDADHMESIFLMMLVGEAVAALVFVAELLLDGDLLRAALRWLSRRFSF
ncbi:hypothetical protein ONE63_004761 [Megalurothrips usitatus]|uniref:Solute-binding protein family 3/N-terminal domain-containing protein n=1 Tax=Megalurothrips usitatus TaxID=439358 RepID=A0AAV7X0P8_9NEOP|nr:hypothetical protein ONE63_004761 [Megalurothrips usitatus]